jgi:hypothetical protein
MINRDARACYTAIAAELRCGCADRQQMKSVIVGLDPAIHPLFESTLSKIDGCADQVRA